MKYLTFILASLLCLSLLSCTPHAVTKTITETTGPDGKTTVTYTESITQIPGGIPGINLKDKELYK